MHDSQSKGSPRSEQHSSGLGALARLGWMAAGPVATLGLGMSIAKLPAWSFSTLDLLFWGAITLMGVLRYLDVTKFDGQDSNGRPATKSDLQRYLVGLSVIGTFIWLGAQSAGF